MLYWLPSEVWRRPEMSAAVQQALHSLRRLESGIDRKRERARLKSVIEVIESAALSGADRLIVLDQAQTKKVSEVLPHVGDGRLPFLTPFGFGSLADLDEGLARAMDAGDGEGIFLALISGPSDREHATGEDGYNLPLLFKRSGSSLQAQLDQGQRRGRGKEDSNLGEKLMRAADTGKPVPLGNTRHEKIVNALRERLHEKPDESPFDVRFLYPDSSLGGPIRLGGLPERPIPETGLALNVGLNSCRHFEIDSEIDVYLLRNAEFDRRDSSLASEQELFAFNRMSEFLQDWRSGEGFFMRLHHTGLEPAVIGSYRAITDFLLNAGGVEPLVVQPVIFYDSGQAGPKAWW